MSLPSSAHLSNVSPLVAAAVNGRRRTASRASGGAATVWAMTTTTRVTMRRGRPPAAAAAAAQVRESQSVTPPQAAAVRLHSSTHCPRCCAPRPAVHAIQLCMLNQCAAGGAAESTDSEEAGQDRQPSRDTDMGDADEAAAPAGGAPLALCNTRIGFCFCDFAHA
jgi:hypothetical protein